jgi:hypothetical protein
MPRDFEPPASVGVTAQLGELEKLREKVTRVCEETRRVVFEYRNIVTLRQQCRTDFIANLYLLYETISVYLHRIGTHNRADHGCNPGKRESRGAGGHAVPERTRVRTDN